MCQGGKTGGSVKHANTDDARGKCGVYIGRWRPHSKLDPQLRNRVAVKVMEKEKDTNLDIQHLVRMDFPYVNHFLGQFQSSRQLHVSADSDFTIMVSSYCPGGDHFSAIAEPTCGASLCAIDMLFSQQDGLGRFCFMNPDHRDEVVNHGMTDPLRLGGRWENFSYMCVCKDAARLEDGVICRVEKVDERFFTLWSCTPPCLYTRQRMTPTDVSSFSTRFELEEPTAKCFMLLAHVRDQEITKVIKVMPRPNVSFIRAFSAQLLRSLGYCHSRKLTAHNGKSRC